MPNYADLWNPLFLMFLSHEKATAQSNALTQEYFSFVWIIFFHWCYFQLKNEQFVIKYRLSTDQCVRVLTKAQDTEYFDTTQ